MFGVISKCVVFVFLAVLVSLFVFVCVVLVCLIACLLACLLACVSVCLSACLVVCLPASLFVCERLFLAYSPPTHGMYRVASEMTLGVPPGQQSSLLV